MPLVQTDDEHSVFFGDFPLDLMQKNAVIFLAVVLCDEKGQHGEIERRVFLRKVDIAEHREQGIGETRKLHRTAVPLDDVLLVGGLIPERRRGNDPISVEEQIKILRAQIAEAVERSDHG